MGRTTWMEILNSDWVKIVFIGAVNALLGLWATTRPFRRSKEKK